MKDIVDAIPTAATLQISQQMSALLSLLYSHWKMHVRVLHKIIMPIRQTYPTHISLHMCAGMLRFFKQCFSKVKYIYAIYLTYFIIKEVNQ